MITLHAKTGTKKVVIKNGINGYGDEFFRASLTQTYNNGFELVERFIEIKTFDKIKKAINWGKRQLN